MENNKRSYDKDPILKEALDLLKLNVEENTNDISAEFLLTTQDQAAEYVIEYIYDMVAEFQGKGRRWYDNDRIMINAINSWRNAPKKTKREAALKLLLALENKSSSEVKLNQEKY